MTIVILAGGESRRKQLENDPEAKEETKPATRKLPEKKG